jgi:transcriptional regulator with XRE-family HTH domain
MTQLNLFILGEKIKSLRENKGLTQSQLAEMVEVDDSLICKIEKGHTPGSLSTLQKLAKALGVTVSKLLDAQSKVS